MLRLLSFGESSMHKKILDIILDIITYAHSFILYKYIVIWYNINIKSCTAMRGVKVNDAACMKEVF